MSGIKAAKCGLNTLISSAESGSVTRSGVHYSDCEAEFDIPVILLKGKQDGRRIWIQAALHGDEYDGIRAIMQLSEELDVNHLSGTVILVPILNVTAFKAQQNASPIDNVNLNRVFGADAKDSFSYRFGSFVADLICENADYMIDLHGGGQYLDVCRFVMAAMSDKTAEIVEKMAFHCGADRVHTENAEHSSKLISELSRRGVPSVLIENGGGLEAKQQTVDQHKHSVLSILRLLRFIEGNTDESGGIPVTDSADLYFTDGGIMLYRCKVGSEVRQGDVLVRVLRSDLSEYEIACPVENGIVLSVHTAAIVKDGQYAVMIGSTHN